MFYSTVIPMDKHGWFSFCVYASVAKAAITRAKKVFLEVNKFMPRTHGTGVVNISEVNAVFENHVPSVELGDMLIFS